MQQTEFEENLNKDLKNNFGKNKYVIRKVAGMSAKTKTKQIIHMKN